MDTVSEYLSLLNDEKDKDFVRALLRETVYVPDDKLRLALNKAFDELKAVVKDRPVELLNIGGSSEHSLAILGDRLSELKIVPSASEVIIVADDIYDHINIMANLDTYEHPEMTDRMVHIITGVHGDDAIHDEQTPLAKHRYYYGYSVKPFSNPTGYDERDGYDRFKLETIDYYPVMYDYFAQHSPFNTIWYEGIVPGDEEPYGPLVKVPETRYDEV